MSERTRIILGMSLIELDHFDLIGGSLPTLAAKRLYDARRLVEETVQRYGLREAAAHLPTDHRFFIACNFRASASVAA